MTEQEAVELGKNLYGNITSNVNNIINTKDYIEFVDMAIKALEEQIKIKMLGESYIIPQNGLWEVNGVDIHKAIEKQIPKKPRFYAHNYYCTKCENLVGNNEFKWQRFLYCDKCGQKLDWSDEE